MESWTAFECLVSDLWVTTLDKEDGTIASKLELSGELAKAKDTPTDKLKHNIKSAYGSFCLGTRRVSFQKLENIKRIYGATFGNKIKDLFDEVEGGYILALYAFRNVLLHRAAVADDGFIELAQRFPEFRAIKVGDKVEPDGEQVSKMRNASIQLGRALQQRPPRSA